MLIDARELPGDTELTGDVCVIGAGAAGITLARELSRAGIAVLLLESGDFEFDPETQDLYSGKSVGVPTEPMSASRLRFFGGTTNHWSGWCRPLEPIDFEARPGLALTGWPISYTAMEPLYRRAMEIVQIGPPEAYAAAPQGLPSLGLDPSRLDSAIFQISPPTRFGQIYRDDLTRAPSTKVVIHANVLELATDSAGQAVTFARAQSLGGHIFTARAKLFVLAAGGLENPRVLLLSRNAHSAGLGNGHDVVGRYFMDHPWIRNAAIARFTTSDPDLRLYFDETATGAAPVFAAIAPSAQLLREEPIGNFRIWMTPLRRVVEGVDDLKDVVGALKSASIPKHLWQDIGHILNDYDALADAAYKTVMGGQTSPFIHPDPGSGPVVGAAIDINTEQLPNPNSRVTLSEERDALGLNRLTLNWQPGDVERRTARRGLELLALEFGRLGLGRVRIHAPAPTAWPPDISGSRHHMGATRMSADPRTGVVDANCQVHGVANLFIAGSSVFPTSGYANPTLTIVALTLRLGDELKRRLAA